MIAGLSSPTYSAQPDDQPLLWLLDRCVEYGLKAIEAPLSINSSDDLDTVRKKAADLGITRIGYWSDDFVTPEGGGVQQLERALRAFDTAVSGGVKTLVIFGRCGTHNRFTVQPPLADQVQRIAENLAGVAKAAAERSLQLGLLPHLDYRAAEMVTVMEQVDHPALKMAFDTANPFPVCEEPVEAAKLVLPHAVAVAVKDVRIYPNRSNDVTIRGTPIGQGSVDFEAILPMLRDRLTDPDNTTVSIKLRLPPGDESHDAWMRQSLEYLGSHSWLG
jgi:sugar phosphate isomerase/epimerase